MQKKKKYIYKKKKFQIFFFIDLHHKRHNHLFILRRLNFNCIHPCVRVMREPATLVLELFGVCVSVQSS